MKRFRQSQSRPKKSSLIIGRKPVLDALQSGMQLDRIYLQNQIRDPLIDAITASATQNHVPVNYVPQAKLDAFNITGHEGCVAMIAKVQYHALQDVISYVQDKGESPLLLILDGITDIRNIGGIARTAYCCGVHAIVIPDKGVGALQEDAMLTSAGALEKIMVCRVGSLMKAVDELHLNGVKVFATDMKGDKNIFQCDFTVPCAFVMGSEDKGIHPGLLKICDEQVKIPMPGEFESLNVSVATGIVLYETTRQRMA